MDPDAHVRLAPIDHLQALQYSYDEMHRVSACSTRKDERAQLGDGG